MQEPRAAAHAFVVTPPQPASEPSQAFQEQTSSSELADGLQAASSSPDPPGDAEGGEAAQSWSGDGRPDAEPQPSPRVHAAPASALSESVDAATERSAQDGGGEAAEADVVHEQAHLEADSTAGIGTIPAAAVAAESFPAAERSTGISEAELAQRASHVPVNSAAELLDDPCVAEAAEPDSVKQDQATLEGLRMDTLPEPNPTSEYSVPEPTSPTVRTSASDLIAAMVRQAEAQEAAVREGEASVSAPSAGESGDGAELPERTDRPRASTVWSDVRLDEELADSGMVAEPLP